MRLIELTRILARATKGGEDLAGFAVQHFDHSIVLIDQVHEPLIGIARYHRPAAFFQFSVRRFDVGRPSAEVAALIRKFFLIVVFPSRPEGPS